MRRSASYLAGSASGSKFQQENAFAHLLRQCRDVETGKWIHSQIVQSGFESSTFLGNLLVQMYGNCGSIEHARCAFDRISCRNVFSWNILLAAFAQKGHFGSALDAFVEMDLEAEAAPDRFTYATILGACANARALPAGIEIHMSAIANGLESDAFVGTALISMYGRCGCLNGARSSFDAIAVKDIVAWNALFTALVQNEDPGSLEALELFLRTNLEGLKPDSFTFLALICGCTNLQNFRLGIAIHSQIVATGMEQGESIQNALVNLYAKCGDISQAREVFDRIIVKDVIAWTSILSAYAQQGQYQEAIQLFVEMDLHGIPPQPPTFAIIPSACSTLAVGRQIHACIAEADLESDTIIGTALIGMYSSLSSFEDARRIFQRMIVKDAVAWNSILEACLEDPHHQTSDFWAAIREMELQGVKHDLQTFMSRIEACSRQGDLAQARNLHFRLFFSGYSSHDEILTSLIHMYSMCGSLQDAKDAFEILHIRNVVAWTAMIAAYAQNGHLHEALECFQQMQNEGVRPDASAYSTAIAACWRLQDLREMHRRMDSEVNLSDSEKLILGTALVTMYGVCGSIDEAAGVFDSIPCADSVAYNAMSGAYVDNERYAEALALYKEMEVNEVQLTLVTMVNAINSCTCLGELKEGRNIHSKLEDVFDVLFPAVVVALVNMYGRCGSLREAKAVFDGSVKKTVHSWNSIVAAYAQHGHIEQSLDLFREMQLDGVLPDKFTYISVLQACSHAGMVPEGKICFLRMGIDHGLIPMLEHYVCMVDLFGRVGQLDSAEGLVQALPFEPDAAIWNALLGGCKLQGDMLRAERTAEYALRLGPEYAAPYVLLANLYAGAGRWEDVAIVRKAMADRGVRKPSGKSFECR